METYKESYWRPFFFGENEKAGGKKQKEAFRRATVRT